MKLTLPVVVSMLVLLASPALALTPWHQNKLGISASPVTLGLETELAIPQISPFTLSARAGGMGIPYPGNPLPRVESNGYWLTGWGTYRFAVAPRTSLGLVLGASQSWFATSVPIPFRKGYSNPQSPVGIVGVTFEHRWEKLWIRVTPTVSLGTSSDPYDFFHAGMLGPALAEVGYRFTPRTELSVRPSITPIAFSTYF
jgi:hypothetical protein